MTSRKRTKSDKEEISIFLSAKYTPHGPDRILVKQENITQVGSHKRQ